MEQFSHEKQLRGDTIDRCKITHGVEVSMEELFVHLLLPYMN